MRVYWGALNAQDQAAFWATIAFVEGRLEERATILWALGLKPNDIIKRLALLQSLNSPRGRTINEPWRSAWRLIEESWNSPINDDHSSTGVYDAQERLKSGERSGSLIQAILDLVAPRLKVAPAANLSYGFRKATKHPRKVEELISLRLTSGEVVDPDVLKLDRVDQSSFLLSLARALDAAVTEGLEIGRRIGWDGKRRLWLLGHIQCVCSAPSQGEEDPDQFNRGIAPSVKLLHAVVSRLVDVDISGALEFVRRWKLTESPVHLRLWAALSRDSRVSSSREVASALLKLDNQHFWRLHDYPEIAELRAKRFSDLDATDQERLITRLRKGPPRGYWPKKANAERVASTRRYWALRELRRIEVAGGGLATRDKQWLDDGVSEFPDLAQLLRPDHGLYDIFEGDTVAAKPDPQYDTLVGTARLQALETAFSSSHGGWHDDPRERASDWIRQPGNPLQILADFESIPDGGTAFGRVWNRFGWAHSPALPSDNENVQRDLSKEGSRVLSLLAKLPESTASVAIEGLSDWLSMWQKQIILQPESLDIWLKLWPVAVEATNTAQVVEGQPPLDDIFPSSDDSDPPDLDTLNSPAGKLVGVFLARRPDLEKNNRPFDVDVDLRRVRDAVITADGRAGLIVRHRLIEHLFYFFKADEQWTREHLISPLMSDTPEAIALWRAVARRIQSSAVLKIIGPNMAERATDGRLGRETRRSLVFSLVIEGLRAYHEQRDPAVAYPRIQQMLRSLDDEARAYGAEAVCRFVRNVSASKGGAQVTSPEALFRSAALPFLENVWPQERSLTTRGVSKALAKLPAAAQQEFVPAVNAIERFLIPFECWSMVDYGLYGKDDDNSKLAIINNREKAEALLRLLDLTIGKTEDSVIPHDLPDALDQIRKVAPALTDNHVFRRLATAARR
jgi:hypothetical protein